MRVKLSIIIGKYDLDIEWGMCLSDTLSLSPSQSIPKCNNTRLSFMKSDTDYFLMISKLNRHCHLVQFSPICGSYQNQILFMLWSPGQAAAPGPRRPWWGREEGALHGARAKWGGIQFSWSVHKKSANPQHAPAWHTGSKVVQIRNKYYLLISISVWVPRTNAVGLQENGRFSFRSDLDSCGAC